MQATLPKLTIQDLIDAAVEADYKEEERKASAAEARILAAYEAMSAVLPSGVAEALNLDLCAYQVGIDDITCRSVIEIDGIALGVRLSASDYKSNGFRVHLTIGGSDPIRLTGMERSRIEPEIGRAIHSESTRLREGK